MIIYKSVNIWLIFGHGNEKTRCESEFNYVVDKIYLPLLALNNSSIINLASSFNSSIVICGMK